jgi:hypothetical protein
VRVFFLINPSNMTFRCQEKNLNNSKIKSTFEKEEES